MSTTNNDIKVLIVDDEAELRKSVISQLQTHLESYTFCFTEAADGEEAVNQCKDSLFDIVLMDVKMPKMSGLEALEQIKLHRPETFVCIMTAHANLTDAVSAIKHGAYDYIEKPVKPEQLTVMVTKALDAKSIVSSLRVSKPIFDDDVETKFVGDSQEIQEVFKLINRLSQVDTTVLIRGENGTGKELVAQAIHSNSPNKHGSFIAINCGAIPENLMESELFGHEKGAFTGATERKIGKFQVANNGTLFLDEIGEMKPDLQVKLLRVLQEKSFMPVGSTREVKTNARIVAATNSNLEKMIEDSTFREDLFYRLNVMPIFMPPLRERLDDLEALIQYFLEKFADKYQNKITSIHPKVLTILKNYDWPGNIRELENFVQRTYIIETTNEISLSSIPENIVKRANEVMDQQGPSIMDFDKFKEDSEKDFIVKALKANKGKINKTVAHANIPKNTLLRKIKKYEINVKEIIENS